MDNLPVLIIVLGGAAAVLIGLLYRSAGKLPEEAGRTPLFEQRCAGSLGPWFYKLPFIRLSVYEDFLVVANFKAHLLRKSDVTQMAQDRAFLQNQLVITHTNPAVPAKIRLYVDRPQALNGWGNSP